MTAYLEPLGSRRAVLMRRQRVGIGDVSRSGCRVEASEPLEIGSIGLLAVDIEGRLHTEFFRVSRTSTLDRGAPRYEAGVEFLPVPADAPSIRDLAEHLDEHL